MNMVTDIRWKKTSFGWKLQFRCKALEASEIYESPWTDVPAVNEAEEPADSVPVVTKVISF